jgi:hypothetical protein
MFTFNNADAESVCQQWMHGEFAGFQILVGKPH